MKLEKTLKTLSSGQKNPKNPKNPKKKPKKNQKTKKTKKKQKKNKKPPGWVKKKTGFFPTLPGSGSATLLLRMFRCVFQFLLVLVGGSSQDSLSATISRLKLVQTKDQLP
jgi:outer membrane biosynthesis protein TonB